MKQSSVNSKSDLKTPVAGALFGATGLTIIGAAAIGVAGYFAWKNREKILAFVGDYIDLPESLTSTEKEDASSKADVGTLASSKSTYTQPTVEHRM